MAPSTILSVRPYGLSSPPPIPATSWSHQPSSRAQVTQRPTRTAGPLLAAPVPTLPSFTQRRPDRLCLRLEHLRHGPYQPPVLSCRHNRAARGAAMSPGLGSSRCPPQTTLPAVLRPLLARPHARTAPHLNQASHSLEAGPGPRGPPQVLAQGVHELTQLLGAHGHLLPDQLQVLWGHGSERPATPALPARDPASPDLPSEKTGQFGQNRTQNPSSLTRGLILTPKVAKKNEDRMAKSRRQPRPSRTPHEGVHRGALRPPGAARMALWSETPQNQGPARFASGRVSVWGHCPDHFPPGPNCC